METKKNKSSAKRIITIVCLSLALLIALGAFSFAWIRNNLEFAESEISAGKMRYKLMMYYKDSDGKIVSEELFNTETDTEGQSQSDKLISVRQDLENKTLIDIAEGNEVFFVVEKLDNSIDFDISLSFDMHGISNKDTIDKALSAGQNLTDIQKKEQYNYIGSMDFRLKNDTDKLSDVLNDGLGVDSYIGNPGDNTAVAESLGYIWDVAEKARLEGDQNFACIRFAINKKAGVSADLDGYKFKLRTKFCVAQKDGLPGEEENKKTVIEVKNKDQLAKAMKEYGFNDEIRVTSSFTYSGDLVFTRPCTFTLNRATLTVKGNVVFSYMYDGEFALNTASEGQLRILKNSDAGGFFKIDLAEASMELIGANNSASGKADIYVENEFTANAAQFDDLVRDEAGNVTGEIIERGLFFKGARICTAENGAIKEDLKQVLINGSTKVVVSNRTTLGELTATKYCRAINIVNNGTITKVNLESMGQDTSMISEPCIDIDNGGYFTDTTIRLPRWSKKFDSEDMSSYDDNTRIKANKGSGEMKAITPNDIPEGATQSSQFFPNVDPTSISEYFYSRGDKGENGYRDDIDYGLRTQFVEVLNEAGTEIIIHYETPSKLIDNYNDVSYLTTLQQYVEHYQANKICAPTNELTKVTIACYGDKVLTADDYAFIKTMTAMTDLDLADAVSDGKNVPDNAFKDMSELTNVKMSESDTVWGKYIFTGTKVIEITFPQALTKLNNPTKVGLVSEEAVLDNIKYIHTSTTYVNGIWEDNENPRYFFTEDQATCNVYRHKGATNKKDWEWNHYWASKFFVDNGAERVGDYFLRYDENDDSPTPKCEFVVYTGDTSVNWVANTNFDFATLSINDKSYAISAYDDYALYDRLDVDNGLEVNFGENLIKVGKYSFASSTASNAFKSVNFAAETELMGYVFYNQSVLASVNGINITTLSGGYNFAECKQLKTLNFPKLVVVEGNKDLYNCYALETVDISVIKLDTAKNSDFYSLGEADMNSIYTKFYIHTDNAKPISFYTAGSSSFQALAASERFIFVDESWAKYYRSTSTYTGVTEMGTLDALLMADENGNKVSRYEDAAYYYVETGEDAQLVACLLPEIKMSKDVFETISKLDGRTVTKIGSAAYHFTKITAKTIKIFEKVTTLGEYAFYAKLSKKYCVDLDLNNVTNAKKGAFRYADMVVLSGDKLVQVGRDTFSDNTNLLIVNLPNLSQSQEQGASNTPPKVFVGCSNLRISYVGYSKDIEYDNEASMMRSYARFVNFVGAVPDESVFSEVNTFVNKSFEKDKVKYRDSSNSKLVTFLNGLIKADFSSDIYMSDWYDQIVTVTGELEYVRLPGYVYYKDVNNNLTLFATSPDINEFWDDGENGKDYSVPNAIYQTENKEYTAKDNGTTSLFDVVKIGRYAYGAVRGIQNMDSVTVGSNIKTLEYGAFSGSCFDYSSSIIVLNNVTKVNLLSVTEIEDYVFSKSLFTSIFAPKLEILGNYSFNDSDALVEVSLPSYKSAASLGYVFYNCDELKYVTLGENTQYLASSMFENASKLETITILRKDSLKDETGTPTFSINGSLVSSDDAKNVIVKVYAGLLAEYKSTFTNGFGGIPLANLTTFENAYTDDTNGAIYYWNAIDESTAYIDYIDGASTLTDITIPSSFEDGKYKVLWVTPEAVRALSAVKTLTLPANMEYLAFSASDLPSTLTTLVIDGNNAKFATDGGVLYNKAKTTVFVYPQSKAGDSVVLPSSVTEIYAEAFYGVKNIGTLTISSVVNIGDRAFANSAIDTIKFTSDTASVFAGKDIISGAKDGLVIDVPDTALDAYKANVLVDYSIIGKMK